MVGHDVDDADFNPVPRSGFANAGFRKVFVLELRKHIVAILCLPVHVPKVDSNFVVVVLQFNCLFYFRCSVQRKLTLNWKLN